MQVPIKIVFLAFFLFFSEPGLGSECNEKKFLDMALSVAINICENNLNYMWTSIDNNGTRDRSNDAKNSIGCKTVLINDNKKIPVKFSILKRLDGKSLILLDASDIAECN